MRDKLNDFVSIEFLKFLSVSVFAALVNFSARILVNLFTSYSIAIIIAFGFGLITAFALNKKWVFQQSRNGLKREFILFTTVNLLALPQTLGISLFLLYYVFPHTEYNIYPKEVAHIVGIGFPVFTSFLGHKYFSFKART